MANHWRLLKTMNDCEEAVTHTCNKREPIEILVWNEKEKQANVTEIKVGRTAQSIRVALNNSLAWRPSEDEEKFKKFLAKLDGDYDAYVLEFNECVSFSLQRATSVTIRESLERELPFGEADYFVFEIVGSRVIILVDNTMSFDIPIGIGYVTRIQKTTPSYAAHDHNKFAKCLKEQREKLEKRFFGADAAAHYCGYDANVTKRLVKFLGAEEND